MEISGTVNKSMRINFIEIKKPLVSTSRKTGYPFSHRIYKYTVPVYVTVCIGSGKKYSGILNNVSHNKKLFQNRKNWFPRFPIGKEH
jgi:hypothetical protein